MGFFSGILKAVGAVVGGILNPVGTVTKLLSGDAKTAAAASTAQAGAAVGATSLSAGGVIVKGVQAIAKSPAVQGAVGGALATEAVIGDTAKIIGAGKFVGASRFTGGGNGKVAKRTIVQTINLDTGNVVNQIILEGAPFLMNKAVRELARTTRKLRKANAKIPRRTVRQSLGSQLTERVLNQTIQDVGDHHHHNSSS